MDCFLYALDSKWTLDGHLKGREWAVEWLKEERQTKVWVKIGSEWIQEEAIRNGKHFKKSVFENEPDVEEGIEMDSKKVVSIHYPFFSLLFFFLSLFLSPSLPFFHFVHYVVLS